jgi:hypothetical protein
LYISMSVPRKLYRTSIAGDKSREGVDDGQHSDLATVEQLLVVHKVHRPDLIGRGRRRATLAQLRLDPALEAGIPAWY